MPASPSEDLFLLWAAHMRQGDFESAWRISDQSQRYFKDLPRHLQPVWRGLPLKDKHVLVRCYRGLGDTIQFVRYAPLLKALATGLSIAAQPELIPLLRTMHAFDSISTLDDNFNGWRYDVDLEITELPYVFRSSIENIPCNIPYFDVPKAPLSCGGNLAVGIVWAAGDWDRRRSLSPEQFVPIMNVPGVRLYSFQRGTEIDQSTFPAVKRLAWRDIFHEAGLMRALDLLISVDTMPAHLAGALGVPVWLLLHADADWRWMTAERQDSPWYPTMRLFRQHRSGEWRPVIEQVARELRNLALRKREKPAGRQQCADFKSLTDPRDAA